MSDGLAGDPVEAAAARLLVELSRTNRDEAWVLARIDYCHDLTDPSATSFPVASFCARQDGTATITRLHPWDELDDVADSVLRHLCIAVREFRRQHTLIELSVWLRAYLSGTLHVGELITHEVEDDG